VKRRFATAAFSGEGARQYGGRWNSRGTAIVYTAESQALAALELLVNIGSTGVLTSYTSIPVTIPDALINVIEEAQLPKNWRTAPAPVALRRIGDEWAGSGTSVVLRVPSVVIPGEHNFLLSPAHPDFHKLTMGTPIPFRFDRRLRGK
jgi:RES domain-containing protein